MSSASIRRRLDALSQPDKGSCLAGIRRGIERESLRVTPGLELSREPHPRRLGATLTHPSISTDYSEAQLEFITPPLHTPDSVLRYLEEIQGWACAALPADEFLWNASMPPRLEKGDASVPVARYGSSNLGKLKHLYRLGLGCRYGRAMQTISGIHYNFSLDSRFWQLMHELDAQPLSLSQYQSVGYFGLMRNFHRYAWLLCYLFGASPTVDSSFAGEGGGLEQLDAATRFLPWATSLRLSDIGYGTASQAGLAVSYNRLEDYTQDIWRATQTPWPPYKSSQSATEGAGRQLNDHVLQVENEYYGIVRPKRTTQRNERPAVALRRRGVEYVEVRCLDVNPLMPLGLDTDQVHFMDVFLLFCALLESPDFTPESRRQAADNLGLSCTRGRHPDLELNEGSASRLLRDWGNQLMAQMEPVAQVLDSACSTSAYTASLGTQRHKLDDQALTPSARILDHLSHKVSFVDFVHQHSLQHREDVLHRGLYLARQDEFEALAAASLKEQSELEAEDAPEFKEFLSEYIHPRDTAGMDTSNGNLATS
ncbi:MAG: glutamate--cysteine ligase [Kistimonas sp.]|nr:glutamate--cysteine ligase [Kistimonas sp.]